MMITVDDILIIANSFNEWLEEASKNFNMDKDDLQELIKNILS